MPVAPFTVAVARAPRTRGRPFAWLGRAIGHALVATGASGWAGPVRAQAPDTVRVQDRARLTLDRDARRVTGTLLDVRGDTLVLRDDDGRTQQLLGRSVSRVERSLGRKGARGALHDGAWGLLVGGGLLAVGGAEGMSAGETALATLTWGALGAVTGAIRRPEQWRRAALPLAPGGRPVAMPVAVFPHASSVLAPRDLVRFATDTMPRVSGIVLAASRDSLLLERGGVTLRYALGELRHLERYYGRTARAGGIRAGRIGAVVGGIVGAMVGYGYANLGPDGNERTIAGAVLVMGLAGAGTGFLVASPLGAIAPADDWRPVRLRQP